MIEPTISVATPRIWNNSYEDDSNISSYMHVLSSKSSRWLPIRFKDHSEVADKLQIPLSDEVHTIPFFCPSDLYNIEDLKYKNNQRLR